MPLLKRTVLLRLKDCLGRGEEMNKVFFSSCFDFLSNNYQQFYESSQWQEETEVLAHVYAADTVTYAVIPLRII